LLSLAGRTEKPTLQPLPTRIGGFGGCGWPCAKFLHDGEFDLLIDATHPFAARISQNASEAVASLGLLAFACDVPPWMAQAGDNWLHVGTIAKAITALGSKPRRVFLAIGRQEAHRAEAAPQHFYLVRSVDPVEPRLAVADVQYILDRGPFGIEGEIALLETHRIDAVIAKNSGGSATYAKIAAARRLGIEVLMVGARRLPPCKRSRLSRRRWRRSITCFPHAEPRRVDDIACRRGQSPAFRQSR
jgi:precorrin-6A/cobalt-precorrin-6A reductase